MRLGLCTAVAVLALSFVAPAAVGETAEETYARFQLFANCEPMDLLVEGLPPAATEIGLNMEKIQAAVESRLRAARLYDSDADLYLYVNVNVAGRAFHSSVEYYKAYFDSYSKSSNYASGWSKSITGTHGGEGGNILSTVSELIDLFLVNYLRVNEEACTSR